MKPISILLAEDHAIVREGLSMLLRCEKDLRIIGEADNGQDAVRLAARLRPDVVVMDIAMPQMNGIEATRQMLQARPGTKIIILSAHSDEAYVDAVMELGASGYLLKQIASQALPEAIRRVHSGHKCLSPTLAEARSSGSKARKSCQLTGRETQMLKLIATGHPNKESAVLLHLSVKTVEKHRQSLMNKLNIHDTAGLTRHAINLGLVESTVTGGLTQRA
ncbi:MAG: response regulator [Prosthecobacter sp.]|jgi:DNA-binding NarL/FixJ family response regulator